MTAGVCMTGDIIKDALDKLHGAVTIVYPMNLPPYDPIRMEFEGQEDLSGTQVQHSDLNVVQCMYTVYIHVWKHLLTSISAYHSLT